MKFIQNKNLLKGPWGHNCLKQTAVRVADSFILALCLRDSLKHRHHRPSALYTTPVKTFNDEQPKVSNACIPCTKLLFTRHIFLFSALVFSPFSLPGKWGQSCLNGSSSSSLFCTTPSKPHGNKNLWVDAWISVTGS